jgi:hypothetical protein
MVLLRVRSTKGTARVLIEPTASLDDLWAVLEAPPHNHSKRNSMLTSDPKGETSIADLSNLSHGDMIYVVEKEAEPEPLPITAHSTPPDSAAAAAAAAASARHAAAAAFAQEQQQPQQQQQEVRAPLHEQWADPYSSTDDSAFAGAGPDDEMVAALAAAGLNPDGTPMLRQADSRRFSTLLGGHHSDDESDELGGGAAGPRLPGSRRAPPRDFMAQLQR